MKRVTYKTAGDATRRSRYACGTERKDELIQYLGACEDALQKLDRITDAGASRIFKEEIIFCELEEVYKKYHETYD